MSVYAISDLHGWLPAIPDDASLLLLAGDICPDHPIGKMERYGLSDSGASWQANWLTTTFRSWLEGAPCPVVAIWGNHDFVGEHPGLVPDLPWTLLHDSEATVNGLRIYGTPWVPGLPRWAFFANERGLLARADAIPEGLDILMSHGPPKYAGDEIPAHTRFNGGPESIFVGDAWLRDRLERMDEPPPLVLCGHIHEGWGSNLIRETVVYNVAAVDEHYVPRQQPFVRLYEF